MIDFAGVASKRRASEVGGLPQIMPGEVAKVFLAPARGICRQPLDRFAGSIGIEQFTCKLDSHGYIACRLCGAFAIPDFLFQPFVAGDELAP